MANDDRTKNRDAIYKLLDDVDKDAQKVEEIGREEIRSARFVRDVVGVVRGVVENISNDDMLPEDEWQRFRDGWNAVKDAAQPIIQKDPYVKDFMITASASTATT